MQGQALALCDYLLPGEGVEAAAERAAELLAPPLAPSSSSPATDAARLEVEPSSILVRSARADAGLGIDEEIDHETRMGAPSYAQATE